jgi:YVTN family beta-propeller protein
VALQQRFVEETIADPSLPLTVGIGLDAGEAVAVEGGYRGGALNVAARLCSLARAGEVLASREIVHLALRVDGVRFTERGQAELKGLDKPVHVVAVRSEERDDALAIAPYIRSIAPPPRTRWRAVAAVVAFAVVAALIAIPLVARRAGGSSEIEPNSVGVLDPESGEITATVELDDRPGSVASSANAVWVTNPDVDTVTRIDPDEQEIRDSIPVGESPTAIAVGFHAVWVVESGGPSVSRISPDTNEVVATIPVGNGPAGIAVGERSVWVTNRFDGTISRINPSTNEVLREIPVGFDPRGIVVGFGDVWVALTGSHQVVRIDPKTNDVTQPIAVGNAPESLAVSTDAVWVVNTLDDTVSRINPDTNTVVDLVQVGNGPSGITVVNGIPWVANEADGTLSRIEPGQTTASQTVIGSVPQGLSDVDGDLWVSVRGTATSHRGGTLRLASLGANPDLDPGSSYDIWSWLLLHLIGDGLLAFEPIGGGNPRLVPDLATEIPSPTDGGTTYSFEIRSGIRYSNGDVVSPEDFRWALERGFALYRSVHRDLYGVLVGGEDCWEEPRQCDLSRGVVTDEETGTISFHLVEPDPEFLYKLTLPFAYPAPPSTSDWYRGRRGIPGTGPYMLDARMTDEGVVLVRNPHFRVWDPAAQPDGYVDRIEWMFGVKPRAQVQAVLDGEIDVGLDVPSSGSLEELFVRSAAQVHAGPSARTLYAVLDTQTPPFDDPDVRHAVNLALDRDRIVEILGGAGVARPTCQQLPPNFPGYEPYCPYTVDPAPGGRGPWSGPDMERAQALVRASGTEGMRVVLEYPPEFWPKGPRLGDYFVELLDELGYRGSVRAVPRTPFYSPQNEFQMALAGFSADYPAASTFFVGKLTCDATFAPVSGFCDPRVDQMIDRASRIQLEEPAAAGALWSDIDRAIVHQAPYLWLVDPLFVWFVSERVGNVQWHLQWGGLLNQLWVR